MTNIVILGAGYAGLAAAVQLAVRTRRDDTVRDEPQHPRRHLVRVVQQRTRLCARNERALGRVTTVDEELRHLP